MIFDFSNKALYNDVYIPQLYDRNRVEIRYGGRDSGKSDDIAINLVIKLLSEEYFRGILMRKYFRTIKDSQFQTIVDIIGLFGLHQHFHITDNPLRIVCKLNGNMLLTRGLDDPKNAKSIKDPTCIWYEEADEISEDAFIDSSLTLRSSRNVLLKEYLSFNPLKEKSWINKHFFPDKRTYEKEDGNFHYVQSKVPNTTILHTTYKDNRFCRPDRVERLEALKYTDMSQYKVKALGLWGGALNGLVYENWNFIQEIPENSDIVFGLDYGFNNPSALVMVGYYEQQVYLKELLYLSGKTPDEIAELIYNNFYDLILKKPVIVDSANPDLQSAMKKWKFNSHPAKKGADSVSKGILEVKNYKLFITKDSLNLQNEIDNYQWKKQLDGSTTDEPVKVDDHLLDAMRYVIYTYGSKHWKTKKSNNTATTRPPRVRRVSSNRAVGFF